MHKAIKLPPIREIDPSIEQRAINSNQSFKVQRKKITCPHCPYSTRDRADLSRHSNDRHMIVKLFQCKICGLCTTQSTNTKQHVPREACCILSFRPQDGARSYKIERNGVSVTVVVGEVMFTPDQLDMHRAATGNPNLTEDEARELIQVAPKEVLYRKALEFRQDSQTRYYSGRRPGTFQPIHISTCAHCGGAYDVKMLIRCHSCQRMYCFQHSSCTSLKSSSTCRHCDSSCAGKS